MNLDKISTNMPKFDYDSLLKNAIAYHKVGFCIRAKFKMTMRCAKVIRALLNAVVDSTRSGLDSLRALSTLITQMIKILKKYKARANT